MFLFVHVIHRDTHSVSTEMYVPELSITRVWPCRPLAWSAYSCTVTSLHVTYRHHVFANLSQFPPVLSRIMLLLTHLTKWHFITKFIFVKDITLLPRKNVHIAPDKLDRKLICDMYMFMYVFRSKDGANTASFTSHLITLYSTVPKPQLTQLF